MSVHDETRGKQVALSGMEQGAAASLLRGMANSHFECEGTIEFTEVSKKSFKMEFAVRDNDIIFHFFLPAHAEHIVNSGKGRQAWMDYWLRTFPSKLDVTAREYFNAEYPRLMAKYTEEMASWWLKAQGFGLSSTDPKALCRKFADVLDSALQTRTETPPSS